jgi:hypothetical protein
MYDNYNFPAGADNQDAPWNQSLSELYDWAQDGNYKPDQLDCYD